MRLNPAFEKSSWHRQAYSALFDRLQIHAGKPARIDIFTYFRPKTFFDPRPAFLLPGRHFSSRSDLGGTDSVARPGGWTANAPETGRNSTRSMMSSWDLGPPI